MRLGLVDDHVAVRMGLVHLLRSQSTLNLVAMEATVPALLARSTVFDLVILDLRLSDGSGPATNIALLRAVGAKVLCYTSGESAPLVREAAHAGVSGFVSKADHPSHLLAAIAAVERGEVVANAHWASAIDADEQLSSAGLTKREAEVLSMYAGGLTADDVARTLVISRETVIDHVRNIRVKYAQAGRPAPTKVHLFQRATEDGLLP